MPRILIADDEPDVLYLVSACLASTGYDVRTTGSKEAFVQLLHSFQPDLVILDVILGADNGRDICRELKNNGHKHVRVILCSAVPELLTNYVECDADAVLAKPFPVQMLLHTIEKMLHRS